MPSKEESTDRLLFDLHRAVLHGPALQRCIDDCRERVNSLSLLSVSSLEIAGCMTGYAIEARDSGGAVLAIIAMIVGSISAEMAHEKGVLLEKRQRIKEKFFIRVRQRLLSVLSGDVVLREKAENAGIEYRVL